MSSNPSPRVFLTGATGFVGGSVLTSLYKAHPTIHVKALIRQEAVGEELSRVYPNFTPVIGTLSSHSLLTSTAADVDFVIHVSGDNVPAVCVMIDGLASSSAAGPGSSRPRLISMTGTRSLIDLSLPITGVASPDSRPWSDIVDARAILSLPKERFHAEADQAIIAYGAAKGVGTMLISPGQLWGRGKGHLKKESHAATYYAAVKRRGRAFVIGDGSATWSWSSIGDLADAVVFLMDQAMMGGEGRGNHVGVNEEGYYFVQSGDVSLRERAEAVSRRLDLGEVESVPVEVAADIHPFGAIMWGCGATFRADKLKELGWKPKEVDWRVLMEEEGGERA